MFDYKKFEDDIVLAMENTLKKWVREHDDIYIMSLDCARDMTSIGIIANTREYLSEQTDEDSEDYWYYKYCEAEWELWEADGLLKEISAYMNKFVEENDERFTNPETFEYLPVFDEHCDNIIEACEKALVRFKQSISNDFPDLLITFNISEYLDSEARTEIFALLNSQEAAEEYAESIEDFN